MAAVNVQAVRPARTAAPAPRRQPAGLPEGFWYSVKRRVLGPPLVTEQLKNQRVRLRGMVGAGNDGRPAMINPAYDLLG